MDTSDEKPDKKLVTCIKVTSGNKDSSFPLTKVKIKLAYDQQKNCVCLESMEFEFKYSCAQHVSRNICSVSSGSYLLSDYASESVVSLSTTSDNVRYVKVSGHPDCLCKISDNVAAVCLEQHNESTKVFVFDINNMWKNRCFEISCKSTGMACIKKELFIASSDRINVYTLQGMLTRHIFEQSNGQHSVFRMTEGPNDSLICVCKNNRSTFWECINIDIHGCFLQTIFCSSKYNLGPIGTYMFTTGTHGQVYVFERLRPFNREVLRINKKQIKKIMFSSAVKAVYFDEYIDMLVAFTANHFYLRYSD